mgnify:CR=1 FL=1
MNHLHFVDKYGSFTMDKPENVSYLYFPLALSLIHISEPTRRS